MSPLQCVPLSEEFNNTIDIHFYVSNILSWFSQNMEEKENEEIISSIVFKYH
jgi:hypothetical protein